MPASGKDFSPLPNPGRAGPPPSHQKVERQGVVEDVIFAKLLSQGNLPVPSRRPDRLGT